MLSSALEHAVPEQLFSEPNATNPAEAVSAVKALAMASAQGQRIYHLTPENQAQTLPNIRQAGHTMTEIRNALSTGKEIIAHADPIQADGWKGAGYIILDSNTGAGAYKIGGGKNGAYIGLGVGATLGVAVASVIRSGGEAIFGIASILANPAVQIMLLSIVTLLAIFSAFDSIQGAGQQTLLCFLAGVWNGFSLSLALYGLANHQISEARTLLFTVLVANNYVSNFTGLPTLGSCGVHP